MNIDEFMTKHVALRLGAYEKSGERKLAYGEWLQAQHNAWRTKNGHDGHLNTAERNNDFDAFILSGEFYTQPEIQEEEDATEV